MPTLETSYLAKVGSSHRKGFGQFFTHPKVADFMVRWVLESGKAALYDPAFGLGAFLDATAARPDVAFTGSEVDPQVLAHWHNRSEGVNRRVEVCREDYLLSWRRRHANIVCNPPYMRFQKFLNRSQVFERFEQELNLRLPGYINAASAFLLKSLSELEPSGRLAYVMPLEFLNTGYGAMVKERLLAQAHLSAIIRLDCEREAVPDATTSVGIILYDTARRFSRVKFYVSESIESLDCLLARPPAASIPYPQLGPQAKWLSYFEARPVKVDCANAVPLQHYGRFSRGIATGANRFFVLRPSQATDLGIGDSELAPVIAKSAQLNKPFFTGEDYAGLISRDAPVLLFNVNGKVSEPAQNYVRWGEAQGFDQRFITRSHSPWYKTESRQPAPLLLGVFSRGGYKIVRNTSDALNLTCFHGFQPNLLGRGYIEHLFLYFHSRLGREIVALSGRKYGDSLDKFEPNDLNGALVPAPQVFDQIPAGELTAALRHLNEQSNAPDCVESWFAGMKR